MPHHYHFNALALLIFGVNCQILLISCQANTNGSPTITGTILQTDCKTFLFSAQYELVCPLPSQSGSLGLCDSHCRCAHKAKWGWCEVRPEGAPLGTGILGDQWCRCSYSDPPQDYTQNPIDLVFCPLWQIVDPLCSLSQINDTSGGCSSDCICSHGFKNGYCDKENYCICTDDVVNSANTFGNYPFASMVNQILNG